MVVFVLFHAEFTDKRQRIVSLNTNLMKFILAGRADNHVLLHPCGIACPTLVLDQFPFSLMSTQ